MYYFIHPRLFPHIYECLKERGAQKSNFSSSEDILEMSSTQTQVITRNLVRGRKAGGREQEWNSCTFLFLTRSWPPIVSEIKSVRWLIIDSPLKCNLHNMLYCLSLSLQFQFHLLRLIFSPSITSIFFSCQVKVVHPSNLFIPHEVPKIILCETGCLALLFHSKTQKINFASLLIFPTVSLSRTQMISCYRLGIQGIFLLLTTCSQ